MDLWQLTLIWAPRSIPKQESRLWVGILWPGVQWRWRLPRNRKIQPRSKQEPMGPYRRGIEIDLWSQLLPFLPWNVEGISWNSGTPSGRVIGWCPSSSDHRRKWASTRPITPIGILIMKHHLQLALVRYPSITGPIAYPILPKMVTRYCSCHSPIVTLCRLIWPWSRS